MDTADFLRDREKFQAIAVINEHLKRNKESGGKDALVEWFPKVHMQNVPVSRGILMHKCLLEC